MSLTHWKKLTNPDYLGSYAFEEGQDLIVTIKSVENQLVTSPDGKKETEPVMTFMETGVKPLVLNKTNSKQIEKLLKTPYVEQWVGKKIQLYVQHGVKAFGDVVDAVRVRPFLPVEEVLKCADCGCDLKPFGKMSPKTLAKYTLDKYGRILCSDCATKVSEEQSNETTDEGVL